jgi:hypothetical protein
MELETILLASTSILFLVLVLMVILAFKRRRRPYRISVYDDMDKIKEQIE